MDIDHYMSYAILGLLGMFMITVIGGMLFGMMRGWKRTVKRTTVLFGSFVIAILITPIVSWMLLKSPLGNMVYKQIIKALESTGDGGTVDNALTTMRDVKSFALGLPIIVLNIVVFWILLVLFRYVFSPIFSKVFLKKFAPKKNADGEKMPKGNIWAGLGMGALQGAIIFAFFFIPVLGFMSTLNKIDSYEPKIGNKKVNVINSGVEGMEMLDDLNKGIRDINTSVKSGSTQASVIWGVTRYSGMQLLGDAGLGYFMRVKAGKTTVNVKSDIEVAFELTRDFVVIYDLVINVDSEMMDLIPVFSSGDDVEYMKKVVDKTFRLGVARLALNSSWGEFVRAENMLEDVNEINDLVDDPDKYRDSMYDGMGNLNAKFIREDLKSLIELARLVFAEHKLSNTKDVSLYRDIRNILKVMEAKEFTETKPVIVDGTSYNGTIGRTKQDALDHVFDNLYKTLTLTKTEFEYVASGKGKNAVKGTRNLSEQIMYVFGNMNVFKKLLIDEDNPNLHSMPLAKALKMDSKDARINDFGRVTDGLAGIIVRVVKIGPTAYKLANEKDIAGFAAILNEKDASGITAIGEILEILTNRGDAHGFISDGRTRTMGLGHILRKFIADSVTDHFKSDGEESIVSFDKVLGSLVAKLSPDGPDIAWAAELRNIVDIVNELGDILNGDINPDDLINKLLSGELLGKIADSELLSELIVDILDGAINEMLGDTGVQFNFDDVENPQDVIKAIGELVKAVGDITEWMDGLGEEGFDDLGSIIDLLGGEGDDKSAIVLLAESGIKIEIEDKDGTVQGQLDAYLDGLDDEDPMKKILALFVFK